MLESAIEAQRGEREREAIEAARREAEKQARLAEQQRVDRIRAKLSQRRMIVVYAVPFDGTAAALPSLPTGAKVGNG